MSPPTPGGNQYLGGCLPTVVQADPVRGWKLAILRKRDDDGLTLRGYTTPVAYGPDDDAICSASWGTGVPYGVVTPPPADHRSPSLDCQCGFYVMGSLDLLLAGSLMSQRLGGSLMSQRPAVVLEVECSGTVIAYQHGWRAEHQRVLAVWLDPLCRRCRCRSVATHLVVPGPVPVCPAHRPADQPCYTPAEIAGLLGVETRWTV